MNRPARPRLRPGGFTLIEILLAFAIFAVAAAALFQSFSTGLRATEAGGRHAGAVLAARSLLERVGADIPLAAGEISGETDGGLPWTIVMRPAPLIDPDRAAQSPVLPFEVTVAVTLPRGRPITLTTLRLAPAAAGAL